MKCFLYSKSLMTKIYRYIIKFQRTLVESPKFFMTEQALYETWGQQWLPLSCQHKSDIHYQIWEKTGLDSQVSDGSGDCCMLGQFQSNLSCRMKCPFLSISFFFFLGPRSFNNLCFSYSSILPPCSQNNWSCS